MKKILFAALILFAIPHVSTSQIHDLLSIENFGFEVGVSALIGRSFDMSIGYVRRVNPDSCLSRLVSGWFFTYSAWQPHWTEPTPDGDEGSFSWFAARSKIERITGQGFGLKYLTDDIGIGVMIDRKKINTYENYRSPETGSTWHRQLNENDSYGVSITLSTCLFTRVWLSGYVGTLRPPMVGILVVL